MNTDIPEESFLRPEHTITITVIIFCTVSITVGVNIILTLCRYNKMEVLVIFSSPSVHGRGLTLGVRMGRLWSKNCYNFPHLGLLRVKSSDFYRIGFISVCV